MQSNESSIKKVLAVTGYFGSGSSAVTDLAREYSSVSAISEFEITFFWGYHGIPNLRYWIAKTKNRQYEATRDFLHDAKALAHFGTKMNYEKYFHNHFLEYSEEYIRDISGSQIGERHYYDFLKMSSAQRFIWRAVNKVYSLKNQMYNMTHTDRREKGVMLFAKKEPRYMYDVSDDEFIAATKKYMYKMFEAAGGDKDTIYVDGLIGGFYIDDISMYFDDFRLIIVRRDPRDVYLTGKYVYQTDSVPKDPNDFVTWFKTRMGLYTYDHSNVLNIRFEDLIFKYDETVKAIENFYGISAADHIRIKHFFKPEVSGHNCRLYEKYKGEEKAIKIIEENLGEYLYPFDQVSGGVRI